ncbi:MAG: ArsR/SmtB family transcription factor [Vicinamibacterales bacterium]
MPASLLGAVASPRRCEILRLLWRHDLTVGAIHDQMPDVTIGAVSLQLKVLLDARLVERRAEGVRRVYHARRDTLAPVAQLLEAMWHDALWRLKLQAELDETRRGPRPARRARRIRTTRRKR